jgi:hypothetical protein
MYAFFLLLSKSYEAPLLLAASVIQPLRHPLHNAVDPGHSHHNGWALKLMAMSGSSLVSWWCQLSTNHGCPTVTGA